MQSIAPLLIRAMPLSRDQFALMDTELDMKTTPPIATVPDGVGEAVGVESPHWYVAFVSTNTEKSVSQKLDRLKIINYCPIQSEIRVWSNGRKAKIDRIVIPNILFIRCTPSVRLDIVRLPFIKRFMTNIAGKPKGLTKPLAVIPDKQIERLRFMLGQSESPVSISGQPYRRGDRVRVIRGNLQGLEGEVFDMSSDRSELTVIIDYIGCARLTINTSDIERIKDLPS